jgi:hypothetical protein
VSRAWDSLHARCTRTNLLLIGVVLNVFHLVTDVVLLLLPVPVVLWLQMSLRKKRELAAHFFEDITRPPSITISYRAPFCFSPFIL